MGIHDLTKVISSSGETDFKRLTGKTLACDASITIYGSSSVAMGKALTNSLGEPTQHIKILLSNVIKMMENKVEQIWVFDNRVPPTEKKATLEERKETRESAMLAAAEARKALDALETKAVTLSAEQKQMLDPEWDKTMVQERKKVAALEVRIMKPGQFQKYVEDCIMILNSLGIRYTIAPREVEAERYAAYLCRLGLADGVLTTDTDALPFGAPFIVKKISGKSGKYDLYERDAILKALDVDFDTFIDICVHLGCDYAPKTVGVGAKTVVRKTMTRQLNFTELQKLAVAKFKEPLTFTPVIQSATRTPESIAALRTWLRDVQNFGEAGLEKTFSRLSC